MQWTLITQKDPAPHSQEEEEEPLLLCYLGSSPKLRILATATQKSSQNRYTLTFLSMPLHKKMCFCYVVYVHFNEYKLLFQALCLHFDAAYVFASVVLIDFDVMIANSV